MKAETRFIIVDDYSSIRALVKAQLLDFGFTDVVEFSDVDQAIAYLDTDAGKTVEFIISDWNMPGKTGLDFLKWVRSRSESMDIPFLILTTENEQAKVYSAVQSGVSNFLLKPWKAADLKLKVQQCWTKHHSKIS